MKCPDCSRETPDADVFCAACDQPTRALDDAPVAKGHVVHKLRYTDVRQLPYCVCCLAAPTATIEVRGEHLEVGLTKRIRYVQFDFPCCKACRGHFAILKLARWVGSVVGFAAGMGGVFLFLPKNPLWLLALVALGLAIGIGTYFFLERQLSRPGPRCVAREPVDAFFDGDVITFVFKNAAYGKLFAKTNPPP